MIMASLIPTLIGVAAVVLFFVLYLLMSGRNR